MLTSSQHGPPAVCKLTTKNASFVIALQVKHGPQPYAHVKANMVRLPYACALGQDSLLHSLVESDVPVQVGLQNI